jgi:hypothetical protein
MGAAEASTAAVSQHIAHGAICQPAPSGEIRLGVLCCEHSTAAVAAKNLQTRVQGCTLGPHHNPSRNTLFPAGTGGMTTYAGADGSAPPAKGLCAASLGALIESVTQMNNPAAKGHLLCVAGLSALIVLCTTQHSH